MQLIKPANANHGPVYRLYEPSEPRIYRIIRFRQGGGRRTTRSNVTLTEAQSHCSKESTHGPGWFDGYEYMPGCKPDKD